jgi:hypothetical protein
MAPRVTVALLFAAVTGTLPAPARGDTEGTAQVYVKSSETDGTAYRGDRYARCIPGDGRGTTGRTLIYKVKADADELEDAYDWYEWDVHLAGTNKGTILVRVATGFRGHEATKDDLALGIYLRGRKLKEFSSLDLAGSADNVSRSVSHYAWCRRVVGFCWLTAPNAKALKFGFALETLDKRLLCFDTTTGELLDGWAPPQKSHLPGD